MQNENFDNLKGKTIVLGIASSIAIYKAADLTSRLVKSGANVKVIMTRNACRLMSARIFQTLSKTKSILRCGRMWRIGIPNIYRLRSPRICFLSPPLRLT